MSADRSHPASSQRDGNPYDALAHRRLRAGAALALCATLMLLAPPLSFILLGALVLGASITAGVARRQAAASDRRAREQAGEPIVSLGVSNGREVTLSERELAAHALILGASGSGKSTTMLKILTAQIERGAPVVALDLKGSPSFAAELQAAAAAAGRPFRMWSPDGPAHWNPLQHGNATELKDKLIATERFTEPHYQRAAERYVQLALNVLIEARPGRPPAMADVVAALEPDRLRPLLRELPPERAAGIEDYLSNLTHDQLSAVRGLGTRLAIITESHTGAYLEPAGDQIDLREALEGREVVVFSLNSSRYGKLAGQLGTLAVQDLITAAGQRLDDGGLHPLAMIAIDELSALGTDNVVQLVVRGREAGFSVLLSTQELADMERAARGFSDQVLGNTDLKLFHRQDVPSSARAVAELGGTFKDWERTFRVGGGLFGQRSEMGGTRRIVDRFIVEPNTIRTLRTGELVRITKTPVARTEIVRVPPPRRRERGGPER
ncbi:MAG TPA: type IV secretion system DNA-binding domain-containing protein [Solirubrobacteraceae bacterium]|jgi:hypothetical protein|nr:type IV secretion system DNA-binding domain-containing protein [Solirubrobacteraceae bacterium]